MSENVPPFCTPSPDTDYITQSHARHGVEGDQRQLGHHPSKLTNVPPVPPKCTPCVPPACRVEAISFGTYYCAAYRREGAPDILLDGADGRPERFTSATAAVKAAELALHFKAVVPDEGAEIAFARAALGAEQFHEVRAAQQAALEIEILGGVVIDGRVVPVEVRRR